MQNTEANRLKLAEAIWETLSLDAIHEQFIFQLVERYRTDHDAFGEDSAFLGLDQ
jgi:hypothetical protein